MDELPDIIDRALRARRYSARQASLEAGSSELIRNIRRGRMPSVERLRTLCEVLELEFYIGPKRESGAIDEARLREAVVSTERTLAAHAIALEPEARARRRIADGGLAHARVNFQSASPTTWMSETGAI